MRLFDLGMFHRTALMFDEKRLNDFACACLWLASDLALRVNKNFFVFELQRRYTKKNIQDFMDWGKRLMLLIDFQALPLFGRPAHCCDLTLKLINLQFPNDSVPQRLFDLAPYAEVWVALNCICTSAEVNVALTSGCDHFFDDYKKPSENLKVQVQKLSLQVGMDCTTFEKSWDCLMEQPFFEALRDNKNHGGKEDRRTL